ncbi:MAG: cytochrome-c oxidase, cbb3-type subunit III [Pseudomonadota bacterium]|nr:cytochrome-c oxidase, cbb3-type subunit III [Pseudomonadota bacterium]
MTDFWSWWVALISIGCWVFVTGVLIFVLRMRPTLEEDGTTGHVYDGIKEYDKPMPRWWLIVFWMSIVWAVFYVALYPSLGNWKGLATIERLDGSKVPWTSVNEMQNDYDRNNQVFLDNFEKRFSGMSVEMLSEDPRALKVGQALFRQNCAVCHGSNARGAVGFPNLTDHDWIWGGSTDKIVETVTKGRQGAMPAWQNELGESGIRATAEYVMSLSGRGGLNGALVTEGADHYKKNCVICHGANGQGNQALGAPNLTDNIWLYGGDRATIQHTLRYGRAGVMPVFADTLGEERIQLVAAYVYQLSKR